MGPSKNKGKGKGKGKGEGDEKILSYGDVVLRRSDLDLLRGPNYLNDRLIEFYFAHLASLSPSPSALLVPPSVSFWLANCPDPQSLRDSLDPLRLPLRHLALFTVNDNLDVATPEGGSHWSLLVYSRPGNLFVHHDTCHGLNRWHAHRLFRAVSGSVNGDGGGEPPRFVEGLTPQQTNGYDCGVYVMAIAKVVYDWYAADGEDTWFAALKKEVDADAVDKLRGEVLRLILSLMERK